MPGDRQIVADALDLHLSPALPDAEGLDGQQFARRMAAGGYSWWPAVPARRNRA